MAPFKQQGPMEANADAQGYGRISAVYLMEQRVAARSHLPDLLRGMAEAAEGGRPSSCTRFSHLF